MPIAQGENIDKSGHFKTMTDLEQSFPVTEAIAFLFMSLFLYAPSLIRL